LEKGTTVVMDSASFHKSRETKELIEKHACKLLFLLPYSPELNPIEHLWHVLKSKLKKILKNHDGNLIDAVSESVLMIN
jgi:transposase